MPSLRSAVAVLLLLAAPVSGCGPAMYPVHDQAAEILRVESRDGWQLALHHYPAREGVTPRRLPVVICHGITSNRHNWEIGRLSFPAWLAARGFDTWAAELRGSGESARPGHLPGQEWDYTFDDYATLDVPAVIDAVAAHAGTRQVHWVGHSMGGMVLYAYLQRVGQDRVRSALVVGSPPHLFDHSPTLDKVAELYPVARDLMDELPTGTLARMVGPLAWPSWLAPMSLVWNDRNMDPAVARAAAAHAVDNVSSRVVGQLMASRADGRMRSADGQHDYTAGLSAIRVPIFFVAGALDQLAPPSVMAEAFRRVSSTDKRIEVLSRANGYRADYGHVDLAIGRHAPREAWPLYLRWLVAHDGG